MGRCVLQLIANIWDDRGGPCRAFSPRMDLELDILVGGRAGWRW